MRASIAEAHQRDRIRLHRGDKPPTIVAAGDYRLIFVTAHAWRVAQRLLTYPALGCQVPPGLT